VSYSRIGRTSLYPSVATYLYILFTTRDRNGRDRVVVGFTTAYTISA